jgi:VWFA-related protein
MRYARTLRSRLILLAVVGTSALLVHRPAQAQTSDTEKPTLKTFGSSLELLKWDPGKQAAVEIKTEKQEHNGATDEDVIRVETRLVVCDVLVVDRQGRPVAGLTDKDFIVSEDGQQQKINHFSIGDDVAVGRSIVLVIDYSFSQIPYISTSVEAAKLLVEKLGPKDRMAIVTDDIKLLVDFTRNKTELKDALESLKKRVALGQTGASAQFSALMATVREMFGPDDIRPIVIFQTDGDETQLLQPPTAAVLKTPELASRVRPFGLNDINSAAEKSRATIYAILSGIRLIGLPEAEQIERAKIHRERLIGGGYQVNGQAPPRIAPVSEKFLAKYAADMIRMQSAVARVAETTGGWTAYLEQPDQADKIYSSILSDVIRLYDIG